MKAVYLSSQNVKPESKAEYSFDDGIFTTDMKKCSWNIIGLGLKVITGDKNELIS